MLGVSELFAIPVAGITKLRAKMRIIFFILLSNAILVPVRARLAPSDFRGLQGDFGGVGGLSVSEWKNKPQIDQFAVMI